ncbi:hypothetical protein LTR09_005239 [Extremus antarcticus]|uniref:NmrA-like domain-containing protein n=1 Tax=Extremus antarcticus TaxID=702011 RepID=A0AAJ0DPU9_9PEZI|nr:hypothetical protein LTR09_005239 [Extremus antarcticus]
MFRQDATAIYAVTDFWEPFLKYLQSGRQDAWTLARADELQRGKNVVDAAGQTLDTLQHFIFSSLPSGDQISNHVLTKLHHHEGKADVVHYLKNSGSKRLADITTVFWCGYYMENFARYDLNPYIRPRKDGSGDLYITTRAAPSTPFGFLATRKDVGLFVASMLQRTPQGVYGPPVVADSTTLTFEGVCEALGKVVGRKIVYRQAALGEMGTHYPVFGGEFDQLYELFNNYGFSGGQKTLGREELGLSKVTTSFETFVSEQNWDGFVVESEK